MVPDPTTSCGPYSPEDLRRKNRPSRPRYNTDVSPYNHDTIGMIVVDVNGNVASGTSTNGARHKVPGYARFSAFGEFKVNVKFRAFSFKILKKRNLKFSKRLIAHIVTLELNTGSAISTLRLCSFRRVGDSPMAGSGSYADNTYGGCAATGDGDVMMRFLPWYAVQ